MPQIVKTPHTKIITKNGETELSITIEPIVIEITINVNSNGTVSVGEGKTKIEEIVKKEEEDTTWAIPQFTSNKINFGK